MRTILSRVYITWLKANVSLRHRLYQIYLNRRKADLAQADLSYLNLSGTDLRGANLRQANLRRADLTGVNLTDADLSGADLTAALVTAEQLAQTRSLANTIMPDGTTHR